MHAARRWLATSLSLHCLTFYLLLLAHTRLARLEACADGLEAITGAAGRLGRRLQQVGSAAAGGVTRRRRESASCP